MWDTLFDSCFSDLEWYISYPHMGKNGNNPHFHVLLPADGPKDIERIRKRIKTAGYTGNKQFSIKFMQNGVQCGIQYCSREGTTPTHSGPECSKWIAGSPPWLNCNLKENLNKRAREDLDNGIRLTIVNHLRLAWKYRLQHDKLKNEDRLPYVVMHMLDDGYYIDPAWLSKSGTDFYVEVFRTSCKAGKLTSSILTGVASGISCLSRADCSNQPWLSTSKSPYRHPRQPPMSASCRELTLLDSCFSMGGP